MLQLKEIDSSTLPEEVIAIAPIECMNCEYDGFIPLKFFKVIPEINNEKEYNELCSLVKEKLGFDSFSECFCDAGYIIGMCRCPECGSEEIFEDL